MDNFRIEKLQESIQETDKMLSEKVIIIQQLKDIVKNTNDSDAKTEIRKTLQVLESQADFLEEIVRIFNQR